MWFEHLLHLHPWDLERMTTSQVADRLDWVKDAVKKINREGRDD